VAAREFASFWINCQDGVITAGSGQPGSSVAHRWVDPQPGDLARVSVGVGVGGAGVRVGGG